MFLPKLFVDAVFSGRLSFSGKWPCITARKSGGDGVSLIRFAGNDTEV
jgi:hypothetical protein